MLAGVGNASAQTYCSGGNTQGFLSFGCNSSNTTTVNQGDYYRFTIQSGVSYNFTSSMPFNPSIYAKRNNSSGSNVFYSNTTTTAVETVNWTATYSGTLAVATRYYWCTTWLSGSTYSPILTYKQNTTINNTTSTASICDDGTKPLTYTLGGAHNNPSVAWSVVGGTGNGSISGNTFTATSPGTVTIRGRVGVCSDDVTFTVLAKSSGPSSLSASSTTICPGDNVTLTANSGSLGAGATYRWYTGGSCSGSPFQTTSSNSVTVSPSSTTTYSVQIVGTCNTTTCRSRTITVRTNSSGPSNITKSTDNICPGASVTLTAQGGSLGTGAQYYWYNGGSCGGTAFAVTSSPTTSVSPTSTSTYSCRIVGTCNTTSCVNTTVNVTQTNSSGPSSLTSSSNPICSGNNITLTAVSGNLGTGASYQWYSNIGCSGSPFTTTGTNTLSQSPSSTTQYSVRISGTCNTTPCQATVVTVTSNVGTPSAPSGVTQRCVGAGTNTYTSSASNASSYSWSLLPSSAGSINSSGTVTWNSSFVGTATVTVTASGCGSNQSSSTSVEVYQTPSSNAGSGGNECDLNVSLQAFPSVGNGTWTQQSGPGTTAFSNANNAATTATVTAYGTYTFRWTEVNGVCSDYDEVTVNFYEQPDANAGGDATVCGYTHNLSATASVGTGTWTKVFGAGTVNFSNANSPTSSVTVPQAGLYVFRWTEVNGTCSDFDEVDITFVEQPVTNAGSGGSECDLNFTFNASSSVGTGTWTKTSGPGTASYNNANSTTATVTVSAYGTYVFRWTEVNGSCTDYDEVTVNFYLQPVAVAGSGGSECDLDFTFSGSTPNAGIGTWTQVSGPGTSIFGNANSPTSTVDATAYGTYTYKWKVVNGTCSDSANVTVNYYEQPVADAGSTGLECDLDHQFNATPSVGTGTWSQAGGAGITTGYAPNANSPTATATVSTYGTYFYTWTEVNGICSSSETVQVLYNQVPTATISVAGEDTICLGDSTLIEIDLTGAGPWSVTYTDGSTSVTVNNISSSPYQFYTQDDATYTVTNVTDVYNCVGTFSGAADVFVNALPVQPIITNLSGLNGFCQGLFTNLSSSSDAGYVSYLWSPNGGTSQVIAANVAGDYVVTVTDTNDCQIASDTMNIVVYPNPVPVITPDGPTTICQGDDVVLTSSAADTYLWSPDGQTTQSITVTTSGNYTVHVVDSNGCEGTSSITQVTVNPLPTATITPFGGSSNGATSFCQGQNVLLLSSSGASYLWSPGSQTSQIISVNSTGTHQVTVTDGNGCSATSSPVSITVSSNPTPTISAGGPTTFCAGGSVTLTASSGNNYLWSNGATTQSITVNSSGSYTVTVGDGNGCSGTSAPTVVTVNSNPTPTISAGGPTTFCAGDSVTLTASSGASYLWSTGASSQSINVTSSGAFTVTVTNASGCSGTSAATNVTVNPLPTPTVSAGGPTTFCAGGSVTLTSSASSGNVWSNGLVGQSITVTLAGSYYTTVTNGNGCMANSDTVTVTVNPNPLVTVTPDGPTNFCSGDDVTLTASAGSAYSWSTGDTLQAITVSSSGVYTVTITDANGCTGTASQSVTVYNNPSPTISPLGPTTFCPGGSVQLVASASSSYQWSPGGQTSQIITVSSAGNYSVTVTDANGCSGTSPAETVTVDTIPTPTITAGGSTTFCPGGSVTLTASVGSSYLWSTGATTQSITATSAGSYTVAVTDGNGCTGTSPATTVTVSTNPTPTITASGPTSFCNGSSVDLMASAGSSYSWSTGDTVQTITVLTAGTYTVTVTDGGGCSGSTSQSVTVYNNPSPTISPLSSTTFCQGGSVQLVASASTAYSWSPGGQTSQIITVNSSGSYSVMVTDANGCSGTSPAEVVTVDTIPVPTITAGGPTTFCAGGSVTLTASAGNSYLWSTGATTQSISATSAGSYTVAVTDGNGCTGTSAATTVTVNANPTPNISANGPTTFCDGDSVTLSASSAVSYAWSNGVTGQSFVTDTSGTYTVTVTDANGCIGTSPTTTVTVNPNPVATITPGGPTTFCQGGSVTLTSSSSTGNVWSTGVVSQSINVTQSGNYTVEVTNGFGCSTTSSPTTVTVNPNPTPVITSTGLNGLCDGDTILLTTNYIGAGHVWTPGGSTNDTLTVTASGTYSVTYTDGNGCTGTSSSITVNIGSLPQPVITALGPTTFCNGGSVTLFSSSNTGNLWSNGATTQFVTISTAGDYTVTVTDGGGCSGTSDTTTISVNANPTPTITPSGPTTFCLGDSVILTSSSASAYSWSTGASTQSITASTAGIYRVTVTDANGCTGSSSATTVVVNPLPTPTISASGPTTFCAGDSVTLTASSASSYMWSNGVTTQSFTTDTAGTFSVMVTNVNGCQATSSSTTVTVLTNPVPTITPSGPTTFCAGGNVTLFSSSSTGNLWSNGATTQFITVNTPGDFTVTFTNGNGCQGTSDTTTVVVNPNPTPTITPSGPTTFCQGDSVVLTVSSSAAYLWSNNATTQSITVNATGNFSVGVQDANGCVGSSAVTSVTVNSLPTPTISANGPTTFCAGDSVTLTASSASSYLWSNGVTTQSFTTDTSGTYSVTVTDANGCVGSSATTTVTVNPNPTPVITPSGPTTFCSGGSVTLTSSSSTGNVWSTGVVSQSITVAQAGDYWVTVTDGNGCTTISDTTTVSINNNPTPTITASGPITFCAGNNVVLTASAGDSYMWSSGDTTQSITVNTSGSFDVFVSDGNGCSGTSATTVVTVNPNPTPTVTPLGPTTFCQGGSVQLLSTASANYLWSPGSVTSQILTATATGSYSVTVTDGNGCSGTSSPIAVTVDTLPTVNFSGLAARYCLDAPAATLVGSPLGGSFSLPVVGNTFNPSNAGVGTYNVTYTYTNGSGCTNSQTQQVIVDTIPVVSFTGMEAEYCVDASTDTFFGTPAGGTFSGPGMSGSIFDPAVAGAGTHSITYYFADGFGCDDSQIQTVIVNPLPTPSIAGIDNPYCEDAGLDSLIGVPSGGTFSGTGMFGDFFDAIGAGIGSHTITYSYTDTNGCFNTVDSVLTVAPLPTVSFTGLAVEYCIDASSATLTGSPVGGIFSGPGISGNDFYPDSAGLGTHTITYTYTDANGCTNSFSVSTDVVGLPTVSFTGLDAQYCVDAGSDTLIGSPAGGTFSGPGIFGNIFNPGSAGEGTYTITYTYTDASGCMNFTTQQVTVNPLPVISFSGLAAQYCINASPSLLVGSPVGGAFSGSGLIGGNSFDPAFAGLGNHSVTFTYTNSNSCTNSLTQQTEVVPLPVVSFSGLNSEYCINDPSNVLIGNPVGGVFTGPGIVSNTNTFSPFLAGEGVHTVQYHYTDSNGCQNSTSQTVTINQLPNVSFFDLDPEYCLNGPSVFLTGVPAGGTFSGSGINGSNFEPQNATTGTHTITYTYTDTNGCTNNYSQNVVVHPLPLLSFTGLGSEYCIDAPAVTLVATPFGGTFSGNGVVGDQFTPADAGLGTHSITYTYTDANGCQGIDVQSVDVVNIPNVSFTGLDSVYCIDAVPENLTGIPSGGTFNGPGMIGNVFDPARAGVGIHIITYSFTNVNGCDDVYSDTVIVNDLPVLSITGLGGPYCIDDNNGVTLVGTPSGGIFDGPGMTGDVFTPNDAGTGTHFITYSYVDTNGCSNSTSASVVVTPLPTVSFTGLASDYCVSDSVPVLLTSSPAGGNFTGPGVFGNTFIPSAAGVGIHAVICNYTDINGCSSASTQAVTVNDLPAVSFSGLASQYCVENAPVTLTGSPTGGVFDGPGISGSSFNPGTAGVGFHTITYEYTDNNGCTNVATETVDVLQLAPPVITVNGPTTFCEGSTITLDAGANYASYAWSDGLTVTQTLVADHSATYAVTVTDTNGCSATSNVITVTSTPLPVVDLGPDFSICPNEEVTLSPSGTHNSYIWSTGESASNINISSDNTYWVDVSNANGCVNRDSVVVTLYNPIVPVIQANGPSTICEGNEVTLDAGPDFTSYSWSDNVTTTQTLDAGNDGAYLVTTVDSNGCEATSAPFIVTVQNLPGVPLYTNGPLSICQGQTLQISTNAGFSDYMWSNGGSGQSITVATTDVYSVTVTDANGCINNSIDLNVTVNANPNPVVTIVEGETEFCKGQDTLILDAGPNYQSYNWTTGDTTRYITVTNSGSYGVSVLDGNGCGAGINSPLVNVTVHNPQTPVISVFPGDTLRSSAALSWQWFFNGSPINGATNQIYVATQGGTYMVQVIDENGCESSAVIEYSPVGITEALSNQYISLYPNPGNGRFTIAGEFDRYDAIEVSISNMLGQGVMPIVKVGENDSINREFDLSGMPKGVYIVEVKFGNERYISRYIKD